MMVSAGFTPAEKVPVAIIGSCGLYFTYAQYTWRLPQCESPAAKAARKETKGEKEAAAGEAICARRSD
jgi:hypothetical protein